METINQFSLCFHNSEGDRQDKEKSMIDFNASLSGYFMPS